MFCCNISLFLIGILSIILCNSSNDCLDVSGGQYFIKDGFLKNCFDKGLSVGEKSNVIVDSLRVESANIAVSVKDYSTINLKTIIANDTPICIESKQKKQEFGGAYANVNNLNCKSEFIKDENSFIKFNTNEL